MTPEEIDKMPADENMDILIGEIIMGWTPDAGRSYWTKVYDGKRHGCYYPGKKWSTKISAAWEVAEKLGPLTIDGPHKDMGWYVRFWKVGGEIIRDGVTDPSAPLAICRAALKAILSKGATK